MRQKKDPGEIFISVERGNIVITVSPPSTEQLRVSDRGGKLSYAWIQEVARLTGEAAQQLGFGSGLVPRLNQPSSLRTDEVHDLETPYAPTVSLASSAVPDVGPEPGVFQSLYAPPRLPERSAETASLVHQAAVDAATIAEEAVTAAAERAAIAARAARDARSAAVDQAAEAVALRVRLAAVAVESRADAAAVKVAEAAFDAALLIASTVKPGSERDAALTATLVATAVSAMAIKTATETASAAADVAKAAAAAASSASLAASDAAAIIDFEVVCAAESVRHIALDAAIKLARQTDDQAKALADTGV